MRHDGSFEWLAGHAALDFCNTVTWRRSGLIHERLQSYNDLLIWSAQAGTLKRATVVALQSAAHRRLHAAATSYRGAIRARDQLHALFVALATGQRVPATVLTSLTRRIRQAMAHTALRTVGRQVRVDWDTDLHLDRMLWPLLKGTGELLGSPDLRRLRLCANPECGWLFLDRSRRHNRRWCSMRECGSRAKARAYYHRTSQRNAGQTTKTVAGSRSHLRQQDQGLRQRDGPPWDVSDVLHVTASDEVQDHHRSRA
jgi:predicted RNA-binding Zn ribbon-like protein